MSGAANLIGERYGRLLVQSRAENDAAGKTSWACACDCGAAKVALATNLRAGRTTSCGCVRSEMRGENNRVNAPHGQHGSPTHKSWRAMIARCEQPCNASYPRYGAMGVTVCARWRESFPAFLADLGARPPGMTLDRIKNELGYEPGNCRWATHKEQAQNRRPRGLRVVPQEARALAPQGGV